MHNRNARRAERNALLADALKRSMKRAISELRAGSNWPNAAGKWKRLLCKLTKFLDITTKNQRIFCSLCTIISEKRAGQDRRRNIIRRLQAVRFVWRNRYTGGGKIYKAFEDIFVQTALNYRRKGQKSGEFLFTMHCAQWQRRSEESGRERYGEFELWLGCNFKRKQRACA